MDDFQVEERLENGDFSGLGLQAEEDIVELFWEVLNDFIGSDFRFNDFISVEAEVCWMKLLILDGVRTVDDD